MQTNDIELAVFHAVRLGGIDGVEKERLIWYCNLQADYDESRLETTIERMLRDGVLKRTEGGRLTVGSQWLENTQSDALRLWNALIERADESDDRLRLTRDELHELTTALDLERPLTELIETLCTRGVLFEVDGLYWVNDSQPRLPAPILDAGTVV